MTVIEQINQLRQLLPMSQESRLLDVLLLNLVEDVYEAVVALRDGEPPRDRGFGTV